MVNNERKLNLLVMPAEFLEVIMIGHYSGAVFVSHRRGRYQAMSYFE